MSPSSYFSISCNVTLYSMELFDNDKFVEKCTFSDQNLEVLLLFIFDMQCNGTLQLGDIRWEKAIRRDGHEMGMAQFLALFPTVLLAGLHMIWRASSAATANDIEGATYFQNDEHGNHMFRCEFLDNKLSVGYFKRRSFAPNILRCGGKTSAIVQSMLQPSPLKSRSTFML